MFNEKVIQIMAELLATLFVYLFLDQLWDYLRPTLTQIFWLFVAIVFVCGLTTMSGSLPIPDSY